MAIYTTTLWLHYSIRHLGSTANSKARWRKNIRIQNLRRHDQTGEFYFGFVRLCVSKWQNQSGPKPFQISHESVTSSVSVNLITLSGVQFSM